MAPFYHGVASGDPLPDRIILWTRVTAETPGPQLVEWEIALDTAFQKIVNFGLAKTDESLDYTVKVDADKLQPDTWYYYRFHHQGKTSITGRTRTTPVGPIDQLRFAVVSCSNFQAGFFNAYGCITERNDVDAIIHLGDYIYEYELGGYGYIPDIHREHEPASELISLENYRLRYSQYHLDADLISAHQQYPWIIVWDDHESADDSWVDGAGNHHLADGPWEKRKSAATRAFAEWLPIRLPDPEDPGRIYRRLQWGDLADLIMLDTRLEGRDAPLDKGNHDLNDECRMLLGEDQYFWLNDQIKSRNGTWQLIGQQVMMAPFTVLEQPFNTDQWDGFPAERNRFYDLVEAEGVDNLVVLTGDLHTSWANDLEDSLHGSIGVEFVTPSVTSPSVGLPLGESLLQYENPHVRFLDLWQHGYMVIGLDHHQATCDWYFVNDILSRNREEHLGASWAVTNGKKVLREASLKKPKIEYPPLAPGRPHFLKGNEEDLISPEFVVLGAYSNPATKRVVFELFLDGPVYVNAKLLDPNGETRWSRIWENQNDGLQYGSLNLSQFDPGVYVVEIESQGKRFRKEIVHGV